ncbi:MAG: hypothetical protein AB1894_01130 [Chloroflexota bacterium]
MSETAIQTEVDVNWKPKVLAFGAILGALVGVIAAYLFIQNSPMEEEPPQMSAGEGVKLGVLVFGLLRSIATLGEGR